MSESRKPILAAAFISGACSLLVEIAGVRVLAPYLGTTIYSWAAVIGFVLASLSIGYYAGGVLADRHTERKYLSMVLLAAGLMTLIIPFLAETLLPFTLYLDIIPASLVGAVILVPASAFYGMVSPYSIKLTSTSGAEGKGAGMVFSVSTIGSIIGALGTGFILIPNMELTHIFIAAAALMVFASLLLDGFRKDALLGVLPFAALAILTLTLQLDPPFLGRTLYSGDSAYYHIRVMELEWNNASARILFLDNAPSSGERPDGTPAFTYVQKTKALYSAAGDVREALVIGAGGGTEIENIKDAFPQAHVTGLEIDPEVVGIGKEFFSLNEDNRTEIVINDARRYVRTHDAAYDLVVIDVFRGASPPYHLATKDFLTELKGKMSPEGIVIINIISPLTGQKSALFQSFHSTFSSVFGNVATIPTKDDPENVQNLIMIASDRDLSAFTERNDTLAYLSPVPSRPPLTDELNPIELFTVR
jgi:spermidine synthase